MKLFESPPNNQNLKNEYLISTDLFYYNFY